MACSNTSSHPDHAHGPNCGHTAIRHGNHTDYIHDGHLHHAHEDHYDEHTIEVSEDNPDGCMPTTHACGDHTHGPNCGHEAISHGDHTDYLVDGQLHHVHDGHCDGHGAIEVLPN